MLVPGRSARAICTRPFREYRSTGAVRGAGEFRRRIATACRNHRLAATESGLAPQLSNVCGRIEAFEGNGADKLPLVVRSADGFGELIFVAVDLNQPPLDRWPGLPQLLAALLGRSVSSAQSPPVESAAVSHLGYNDLSGQLRSAIDQFPGVRVTPFWLVAVLASGYVLLLFPRTIGRELPVQRLRRLAVGQFRGDCGWRVAWCLVVGAAVARG